MPYAIPNPQFHTFEIDVSLNAILDVSAHRNSCLQRGLVGLSFCDKEEAEVFVGKPLIDKQCFDHLVAAKIRTQTPKPTGAQGRTSSASVSQFEPETRKKSGSKHSFDRLSAKSL